MEEYASGSIADPISADAKTENRFFAGFGEGDISPTESVPLQGFGDSSLRMSTEVLGRLYSRCLAVRDDQGSTALLISVDNAAVDFDVCQEIRDEIEAKVGVPASNTIVSAIHEHSTPDYDHPKVPSTKRYRTLFINATVQAAVNAIEDLAPAEMYINSVETEGLNFVRNYICNDGTCAGPNYGSFASGAKDHESKADAILQLVKFARSGKKDIIVSNFQLHPYIGTTSKSTVAHSDCVGVYRDALADKLNCHVVYFSGAGGNVEPFTRIKTEHPAKTMWEHGEKLADYAVSAEGNYVKVNTGRVRTMVCENTDHTDKSRDALYDRAVDFMKIWNEQGQKAAQAALPNYPEVHSIYPAKYVVIKHDLPETRSLPLSAVSFGDVAFTGVPVEMFDTNGQEIKSGSPFKMTIVTTLTNGWDGYIPSRLGFDNGGYSTDITRYAPGTGEKIVQDLISMLTQIHDAD